METLTPAHVQAALDTLHLGITIRLFPHSTATAPLAAEAIGCEVGQIAKSLCFVVHDHPILVIASGDQRVDDRKLAMLLGVTRKAVKFATPDQCVAHWGYAPGSVPPVGHRQKPHAVYLDDTLQRYTHLYPAGGANNAIFGATLAQLARMSGGTFVDVKRDP
ncbi:MAG TPA: YbaK/EbsC family protein [Candidatus Tectomicrobia bacterium]